uniref:Putative secreted peptide n=1 Tax=Anopheles braziliensis TaxID=58242 RepID=A0A2M3ZQ30_9DIPT
MTRRRAGRSTILCCVLPDCTTTRRRRHARRRICCVWHCLPGMKCTVGSVGRRNTKHPRTTRSRCAVRRFRPA